LLAGADIDVEEDLEMVGQELDRSVTSCVSGLVVRVLAAS